MHAYLYIAIVSYAYYPMSYVRLHIPCHVAMCILLPSTCPVVQGVTAGCAGSLIVQRCVERGGIRLATLLEIITKD